MESGHCWWEGAAGSGQGPVRGPRTRGSRNDLSQSKSPKSQRTPQTLLSSRYYFSRKWSWHW